MPIKRLSSNRDLDLNPSLDIDNNLLHDLSRRIQTVAIISARLTARPFQPFPPKPEVRPMRKGDLLNQPLMDPHLKHIPRLAPLPAGRLPCGHLQALGRQAHGALDAQVLGLGPLDQLLAYFLERLHFARGQGDADFVDFLSRG